jgi:PPOX class probable FMN-dependent enzyme
MSISWRVDLDRSLAAHGDDPVAKYLSLATVGYDTRPSNRMVVFRGFKPDTNELLIVSDGRATKITEIRRNARAEACWYFPKTREQYRIAGSVRVLDGSDRSMAQLRVDLWRGLTDDARKQYTWPTPGTDWVPEKSFMFDEPAPNKAIPPIPFFVLMLSIDAVDYLSLATTPPTRRKHEWAENTWKVRQVNP